MSNFLTNSNFLSPNKYSCQQPVNPEHQIKWKNGKNVNPVQFYKHFCISDMIPLEKQINSEKRHYHIVCNANPWLVMFEINQKFKRQKTCQNHKQIRYCRINDPLKLVQQMTLF